jgi:large subunit ribosomal protein L29
MKMTEIKSLSVQELKEKSAALQKELFNLRFQDKMGQLSNPVRLRIVRRDIARVKTLITEKKSAQTPSPAATSK